MLMRKEMKLFGLLGLLFIAVILAGAFVAAVNETAAPANPVNPTANIYNQTEELKKLIGNQTMGVPIPAWVQNAADFAFKLEGKSVDFPDLIILIALWVVIMMIIKSILEIVPFFGKGWKSWAGGIIVTLLASISGGIKEGGIWILGLADSIKWLDKFGQAKVAFVVILFIIVYFALIKLIPLVKTLVINPLKTQFGEEEAEMKGFEIGVETGLSKKSREKNWKS